MGPISISRQQRLDQIRNHLSGKFQLPREQIDQMLPEFVKTLGSHMEKLQQALAAGDLALLGSSAHTIKGAFLNLGLDDCVELAKEVEVQGKALNEDTDYAQLVEELRDRLGELID
ncbi:MULTISPECIES: Hpt domain-containing protein [Desulfosediminicola]|uniref:Hpt domain-containing protein n=1 Tax=Desulfosediminicola TaxID=2886823 RepID=UPI0010AC7949|nr:Hpt domain-containing protein [Desulfosediminicola ganghwensis]